MSSKLFTCELILSKEPCQLFYLQYWCYFVSCVQHPNAVTYKPTITILLYSSNPDILLISEDCGVTFLLKVTPLSVTLSLFPVSFWILFHPLVLPAFLSLLSPSAYQYGLPLAHIRSDNCPFSFLFFSACSVLSASTASLKLPSLRVACNCLSVKSKGIFFISYFIHLIVSHGASLPFFCGLFSKDLFPLPILSLFMFPRVPLLALIL